MVLLTKLHVNIHIIKKNFDYWLLRGIDIFIDSLEKLITFRAKLELNLDEHQLVNK